MSAQPQPDTEPDEHTDADACRAYLSRLLREMRVAEQAAQAARARAQAASDRIAALRRAGREPQRGTRHGR